MRVWRYLTDCYGHRVYRWYTISHWMPPEAAGAAVIIGCGGFVPGALLPAVPAMVPPAIIAPLLPPQAAYVPSPLDVVPYAPLPYGGLAPLPGVIFPSAPFADIGYGAGQVAGHRQHARRQECEEGIRTPIVTDCVERVNGPGLQGEKLPTSTTDVVAGSPLEFMPMTPVGLVIGNTDNGGTVTVAEPPSWLIFATALLIAYATVNIFKSIKNPDDPRPITALSLALAVDAILILVGVVAFI